MTLNNRLLTTIQVAVLLYKERIGHDPGAILLERGAYDVVTEATREVTLIRGQNGKATVTLFGIPVERVLRPGYGFYISERCCVNPGGAENAADEDDYCSRGQRRDQVAAPGNMDGGGADAP